MKLSPKQADYYLQTTQKSVMEIIIAEGTVRSGKTFVANLGFLWDVMNAPPGTLLLSGRTKDSIRENVLADIFTAVGEQNYRYFEQKGILYLFGRKIEVYGAEKADAEPRIRGRTYAGWYGDEITVQHPKFVKQAIMRCSIGGAKIRWTTNPDHPKHYIKKDFIDNKAMKTAGQVRHYHFNMDDNWTLTKEYKALLKASFSGVMYHRNVMGLWAVAEGLVYAEYQPKIHQVKAAEVKKMVADGLFAEYIAGTDWGFTHPMVGLIYGVTKDPEPQYVQIAEFYKTQQRTEDLADWYLNWEEKLGKKLSIIYCDSAEPDRIVTLKKKGLRAKGADKEMAAGINTVGVLLKADRIRVSEECTNTDTELQTYRYPDGESAAAKRDEPLDEDNHAMDGKRYVLHNYEKYVLARQRKLIKATTRRRKQLV